MKIDVKNMKGEVVNQVELPRRFLQPPIYMDLMHQAYVHQEMANARLGTHETKVRHGSHPAAAGNPTSKREPVELDKVPSVLLSGKAADGFILRICVITLRTCRDAQSS